MRILLLQDDKAKLDLVKCAKILNQICQYTSFDAVEKPLSIDQNLMSSDISGQVELLLGQLSGIDKDYIIYITLRRFSDNWFFHAMRNTMILSFHGWKYYTTLPKENGLFYFIADELALRVDRSYGFRHKDATGCIYDFLGEKTAVDLGLKMGRICQQCQERIRIKDRPKEVRNSWADLIAILEVVAGFSRWGKNVLDFEKDKSLKTLDWSTFEAEVARLYRALGAKVRQNVNKSGFEIDVYAEEETPSKQRIRTAIECKLHKAKVGNLLVNDFARKVATLKEAKLVDKGIIVSHSGFSPNAYLVAEKTGIELMKIQDLKQLVSLKKQIPIKIIEKNTSEFLKSVKGSPKKLEQRYIFTIIPFSQDFDDVYYLGIHETVTNLGYLCKRVDEEEFVGDIVSEIYELITNASLIIAEVSVQNPNVYYELGYAHAQRKPVILLTKDIDAAPFDLRGQNHIIYNRIVDLRKKLKDRLSSILL